jgi:mannose-1-phosphate guanylyltransferase
MDQSAHAGRAALILAGGAGTRLWPLSTAERPKQFLRLFGGESLLQRTAARLTRLIAPDSLFIATNERYAAQVAEQLPELPEANILLEPAKRNTAPAIAACSAVISRRLGDVTLGVFPSDAAITDEPAFIELLESAYQFAAAGTHLLTIGIEPNEPSSDFGYLDLGEPLQGPVVALKRFVEKPSREKAEEFLKSGNFAWNGGMFLWRSSYFAEVLEKFAPDIARGAKQFATTTGAEQRGAYEAMPSISIDFAVMEKAPRVATARGEFGWSDVGSWAAVAKIASEQQKRSFTLRSSNTYAHSDTGKKIAIVGVSDIAVIESDRGILVLNLNDAEGLSKLVEEIEK